MDFEPEKNWQQSQFFFPKSNLKCYEQSCRNITSKCISPDNIPVHMLCFMQNNGLKTEEQRAISTTG